MDKTKVASPPPGAAQKPPDMREIMADYDKAVKFFHEMPAEAWEGLGQKTAMDVFQETLEKVPVYSDFLKQQKFDPKTIVSFEDFAKVPTSDKYNYVQKYGFDAINLVKAGKNLYGISLSSGTVDEPTVWPRYYEYEEFLPMVFDLLMRLYWEVDKKRTLLINAFNMGVWISGMTVNAAIRPLTQKYHLTMASTGSDLESITHTVKLLSSHYDQTIIFSYPTFIRTVLDRLEQEGINLKKLNLKMFIAGEGHTVEWRQYINKVVTGNSKDVTAILDGYGVTDTGLLAMGSALTNLIRDLAQKDPELCRELFGKTDNVPSLFQYNPATYFIEEINGEVFITTKSTTPLIRYNLHDRGGVIKFRQMVKILELHNYDFNKIIKDYVLPIEIIWQQPFVYCFGRREDTVIIGGGNIFPEQIEPSLINSRVKDIHSFKLGMKTDESQHQMMQVILELKEGIKYSGRHLKRAVKKYHDLILRHLLKVNADYAVAYRSDPKYCDPIIEIFERGKGPFREDLERSKPRLIVKNK